MIITLDLKTEQNINISFILHSKKELNESKCDEVKKILDAVFNFDDVLWGVTFVISSNMWYHRPSITTGVSYEKALSKLFVYRDPKLVNTKKAASYKLKFLRYLHTQSHLRRNQQNRRRR